MRVLVLVSTRMNEAKHGENHCFFVLSSLRLLSIRYYGRTVERVDVKLNAYLRLSSSGSMTTNYQNLLGVGVIWECCQYVYLYVQYVLGCNCTLSIQYYVLSYIQERFTEATENFMFSLPHWHWSIPDYSTL